MQIVPLQPLAAQELAVSLGGQACRLRLMQRPTGLFADIYVNDALLVGGVVCENANPLVRGGYLGFVGNLAFLDLEGRADPEYTGLGGRFVLAYLP